jgi:PadR family transcriptional regulator PadR
LAEFQPPPIIVFRYRNPMMDPIDKPLQRVLAGFIRMHVLHHAEEGELFGQWMIEELRRHGYNISAGTLYPLLRAMEKDGWIEGRDGDDGARRRRLYKITTQGRKALDEVRARLGEMFREVGKSTDRKKRKDFSRSTKPTKNKTNRP